MINLETKVVCPRLLLHTWLMHLPSACFLLYHIPHLITSAVLQEKKKWLEWVKGFVFSMNLTSCHWRVLHQMWFRRWHAQALNQIIKAISCLSLFWAHFKIMCHFIISDNTRPFRPIFGRSIYLDSQECKCLSWVNRGKAHRQMNRSSCNVIKSFHRKKQLTF